MKPNMETKKSVSLAISYSFRRAGEQPSQLQTDTSNNFPNGWSVWLSPKTDFFRPHSWRTNERRWGTALSADLCWCLHTYSRSERGGHSVDLVVNCCSLDTHLNNFNSSFPQNVKVTVKNVHDSHPWFLGVEYPNQSYHLPISLVGDTRGPEIPSWCGNFSISHKFLLLARKEKKRHI